MDDIGAVTDRGGYVFIQAKLGRQLGEQASSPLGEALDQAVRQFIDGAPLGRDGTRRRSVPGPGCARHLHRHCGLSTCPERPAGVVISLAGYPKELPLDQLATNPRQQRALKVLLACLSDAFAKRANGTPPSEEQLWDIGRCCT